jgi:hypothetical protein
MNSIAIAASFVSASGVVIDFISRKVTAPPEENISVGDNAPVEDVERLYRDVAGNTANGGEYLISYYMSGGAGTRHEAMQRAIDELLKE